MANISEINGFGIYAQTASLAISSSYAIQALSASWAPGGAASTTYRVTASIDFGFTGSEEGTYTQTTVSASWVTNDSIIIITPSNITSSFHTPEDYILEQIQTNIVEINPGVSFTLSSYAPNGSFGDYNVICTSIYV